MEDQVIAQGAEGGQDVSTTPEVTPENNTTPESQSQSSVTNELKFTDSFGNQYSPEEFQSKFNEINSSFTSKAQEAKNYKEKLLQYENQSKVQAQNAVNEDPALKNMPIEVKTAIEKLVQPMIQGVLQQKEEQQKQQEADRSFLEELSKLESKYDGKNGLPKFNRQVVLDKMKDPSNRVYDPELVYRSMNEKAYNEFLIKQALKSQGEVIRTEGTGSANNRTPTPNTPKTWSDASRSARSRLNY